MPERPAPAMTMDDLDRVIGAEDLMPQGTQVRPLGAREYALRAPGMTPELRVTTDPDYYEEHTESVEFWSPGNPLFNPRRTCMRRAKRRGAAVGEAARPRPGVGLRPFFPRRRRPTSTLARRPRPPSPSPGATVPAGRGPGLGRSTYRAWARHTSTRASAQESAGTAFHGARRPRPVPPRRARERRTRWTRTAHPCRREGARARRSPQCATLRHAAVRSSPRQRARGCGPRCARQPRARRRARCAAARGGRGHPWADPTRRLPQSRASSRNPRSMAARPPHSSHSVVSWPCASMKASTMAWKRSAFVLMLRSRVKASCQSPRWTPLRAFIKRSPYSGPDSGWPRGACVPNDAVPKTSWFRGCARERDGNLQKAG